MIRPYVTIAYAQTLDGRVATRSGSSQWISGPQSLVFAHRLRAEHDAIMVGAGTVVADDPRLTVRHVPGRDPLRVVVDSRLRISLDASVLAGGAAHGTLLAVTPAAAPERRAAAAALGAEVLVIPADDRGRVELPMLLAALAERGIGSLMVEGGAALITSLLRARLVDRLAVCVAPLVLGTGIEGVGDLGIDALGDALRLHDVTVERYGADIVIDGRLAQENAHATR